jgi:protein-S-isoprenylcysteine O-methyltransferase Ste14
MSVSKFRLLKAMLILPGNMVVLIPAVLLYLRGTIKPAFGLHGPARWAIIGSGVLSLCVGFLLSSKAVSLFVHIGEGTPAPWDPPRKLVIQGPYRYVRNPMITGAIFILLAEALLLGSIYILIWAGFFFTLNHFRFILAEEPGLEKRFGEEYIIYKKNVPRWIPRITPYREGGKKKE